MSEPVLRHTDESRFEMLVGDDLVSYITYSRTGEIYAFEHTITPPAHRGQGYAGQLTEWAVGQVAEAGGQVRPVCPYTQAWFDKHPDYQSVVAE